jgi:hypothetical protein
MQVDNVTVAIEMVFGRGNQPVLTIRNVPKWDEVVKLLGQWTGVEFEVVTTTSIAMVYGRAKVEAARDQTHVTMLVPSSFNDKANFREYVSMPLSSLRTGSSSDAKGGAIVGQNKTCVNRVFVDGFVKSVTDIYSTPSYGIQAMIHYSAALPLFLVSDQLTYIIAPRQPPKGQQWQTGNYV